MYDNKYNSAKVNGTEFKHRILKDNKHCNISVKPISILLLDSIRIHPNTYCSNKYYPKVFFQNMHIHKR